MGNTGNKYKEKLNQKRKNSHENKEKPNYLTYIFKIIYPNHY